ncbi:ORF6N domain-containing protein [Ferruginibacter sp.]|nr:ORF6N domain-containing protein [Ferruginibacter sp.]
MNLTIIQNKIYEIREQKVMLDFDLAELYEVETKAINQAVKRNSDRFPEDFMFRLMPEEWETMRSQFVTASEKPKAKQSQIVTASQKKRNVTATPYAFTEHGVTMLASILRSDRAVKMNIAIVRAFIALRQIALNHKALAEKMDQLKTEMYERLGEHDTQLNAIYDAIENMLDEKTEKKSWEERERIGFKK